MTEDTRSGEADGDEHRGGPIGTVVGATLGPFAGAVGTVVDDTRFALKVSMGTRTGGGGGTGPAASEGTTIQIEDAQDAGSDAADGDDADDGGNVTEGESDATEPSESADRTD